MALRPVEPHERCDRCGHQLREHASAALGTICMVGRKAYTSKHSKRITARFCPCDGFFAEPRSA